MDKIRGEQIVKMRYTWFIGGALLGFLVGAFSPQIQASDENGDVFCLAQNIYFESSNQPYAGKVAVAQVVMNRMELPSYPHTVCDVVYQAKMSTNWKGNAMPVRHMCQFSWYCDGKSDMPTDSATWMLSMQIARDVITGRYEGILGGASHYHSTAVEPYWASSLTEVVTIDQHIFYK